MFSKYLNDPSLGMICSDEHFIRKMLDFEIALAQVQATLGIIPKEAAQNIEEKVKTLQILPESLAEGTLQNGIPTITLINLAKKALPDAAKDYLHWGATSQDVMDTAQVLIIKEAIVILEKKIYELLQNLAVLIDNQGNIPTIGRTRTQQAVPILFGQKIANWASPFIRHLERLAQLKPRLLVAQLGGAAGNLSALGNQGLITSEALAKQLDLNFSLPWHNQRDNFAEFTNWLALVSESLGKMGQDILLMSQTEINELVENAAGGGKSSTMPHKNNPILSETLVVLAKKNASFASIQLQSMIHGNERDGTAWLLEWENLPKMILNTGTALNHALTISKNLKANPDAMQKNIDLLNGLVFSEAASFILAQYLPRNEAKIIVEKACQIVVSEGKSLEEALLSLTKDLKIDWHSLLDIDNHLGASREIMNKITAQIKHLN